MIFPKIITIITEYSGPGRTWASAINSTIYGCIIILSSNSSAGSAANPGRQGAVLAVENGWFVDGKKVMIERCWMRTFSADQESRSIDFQFVFIPVDNPITLRGAEGKSYGGLNMRFAVKDENEAIITVPDGVAKKDLTETPLPWAI